MIEADLDAGLTVGPLLAITRPWIFHVPVPSRVCATTRNTS